MQTNGSANEPLALRKLISDFINERKQFKLNKCDPAQMEEYARLEQDYTPAKWLADAAGRSSQIQLATHTLKPIHPDARGSNLYVTSLPSRHEGLVGSHCLQTPVDDVVGNAAALDIFKLLKLSLDGQTILQRVLANDTALRAALSDNPDEAEEWMRALLVVTKGKDVPASHTLAKQLYFPLENGEYHVLAPLFPSSLVHHVQRQIKDDLFSKVAETVRAAWRAGEPSLIGFREYSELLIQKFGGTKPQNISQLNSERRGENWLLPSLPPTWRSSDIKLPMGVRSVFERFLNGRKEIRRLTRELREFLARQKSDHTNFDIRKTRAELIHSIIDEVILFASEIQDQTAWTLSPKCELDDMEALWLDPYRVENDVAFRQRHRSNDWQGKVAIRFGNWLNRIIETDTTPMGVAEHHEWSGLLDKELRFFQECI